MRGVRPLVWMVLLATQPVGALELTGEEAKPEKGRVSVTADRGSLVLHSSLDPGVRWSALGDDSLTVSATQAGAGFVLRLSSNAHSGSAQENQIDLWVGPDIDLVAQTDMASVVADGLEVNTLEVNTVSGDILLNLDAVRLSVTTVSSNLILEGDVAHLIWRTVSGDAWLMAKAGKLQLDSNSGTIRAELAKEPENLSFEVRSALVEIVLPSFQSGVISGFNHAGETRVMLPPGASASVTASSIHGHLSIGSDRQSKKSGLGRKASAMLGEGEGTLVLESFSGPITVLAAQQVNQP